MKLIDADSLKEHKFTTTHANGLELEDIEVVPVVAIDNASEVKINLDVIKEFLNKRGMEVITKEKLRILKRLSNSTYGLYRLCPYCNRNDWVTSSTDYIMCLQCESIYKRNNMLKKESKND